MLGLEQQTGFDITPRMQELQARLNMELRDAGTV
jgi:hypothetical protein